MRQKDFSPRELYELLQKRVIGQDEYLKKLSMCVWMHNKRIEAKEKYYQRDVLKQNLLVIGPSGVGKTHSIQKVIELYGNRFDLLIVDMTQYTNTGWKGRDVSGIIEDLYSLCGNKERTEQAIVYLDELDKSCLNNRMDHDDGFAVEPALLKLIEGTLINVGSDTIDTSDILFIGGGAFEGLDKIKEKLTNKRSIGFLNSEEELLTDDELFRKALQEYGMGVQLLGRFSDIAVLNKLGEEDLTNILLESKSSVITKLDNTLRASCNVRVSIDEFGALSVAHLAHKKGTGARGLNQIITPLVNEALFNNDDKRLRKITITKDDNGPKAELIKAMPVKREEIKGGFRGVYDMPHLRKSSIENFSWRILSFYFDAVPQPFSNMKAVHSLLCSIVWFVLRECNPEEQTIFSIQKLVNTTSTPGKESKSVYETLMDEDGSRIRRKSEYLDYYKKYRDMDEDYKLTSTLEEALTYFCNHGNFTK